MVEQFQRKITGVIYIRMHILLLHTTCWGGHLSFVYLHTLRTTCLTVVFYVFQSANKDHPVEKKKTHAHSHCGICSMVSLYILCEELVIQSNYISLSIR